MANQYYYLIAGLPDLAMADKKLPLGVVELRDNLYQELQPSDRDLVKLWFLPFDHSNITNTLFGLTKPFDLRGIFTREEVDNMVDKKVWEDNQPEPKYRYITNAIAAFYAGEDDLAQAEFEQLLLTGYYKMMTDHPIAFVRQYAQFDQNLRNVFAALNGRKFDLPFHWQLVGEGEVVDSLTKSRARDFGLSVELENIESLVQVFETEDLLERELKIDMLRWQFLEDAVFFNYFTIERVLAFLLKLMIVERWLVLDEQTGRDLFRTLLAELESGYVFPEEYKLSHGKKQ